MSGIVIENLYKSFDTKDGTVEALKNVNLSIESGDIYGIIGMSGAGKSTLVRCINFLEVPTKGRVLINGKSLGDYTSRELRKQREDIGMIFQHFNLISGSTIAENVAFSLYANNYPKDKIKDRVKELLEIVHLPEKADAYPANLSGGQKQRVAIEEHWRTIQISCYAMKQPPHWILRIQKKSWNYYERSMKKHISRSYLSHMRWM